MLETVTHVFFEVDPPNPNKAEMTLEFNDRPTLLLRGKITWIGLGVESKDTRYWYAVEHIEQIRDKLFVFHTLVDDKRCFVIFDGEDLR